MPANILNLPSYTITNIEETENDYHINAETKTSPQKCPHCHRDNLVGFGRNEQLVRNLRLFTASESVSTSIPGATSAGPATKPSINHKLWMLFLYPFASR